MTYVQLKVSGGQVKTVALSDDKLTVDTIKSVAKGAVNIIIEKVGKAKVAGSIKNGEVQAPPGGWDNKMKYEVVYEDKEEVPAKTEEEKKKKGEVVTKLENDLANHEDAVKTIKMWAGDNIEEKDFLKSNNVLKAIDEDPALRGTALKRFLTILDNIGEGGAGEYVLGVAETSKFEMKVRANYSWHFPSLQFRKRCWSRTICHYMVQLLRSGYDAVSFRRSRAGGE